jgi:hypothetical protein
VYKVSVIYKKEIYEWALPDVEALVKRAHEDVKSNPVLEN